MLDFLGKISSFLYYVFALFIISITIYYGVFKGNQFLPKELNDFECEVMYKERYCNRDWVLNRIAYTNYWIWSCEICDSLKYDKSFVLDALEFKNDRLFSLEDANSFANDKDVVLKAINTGSSLRFASSDLQCNKDIVLKSIEASSWNFSHICNELANDKEVITSLFKNSSKDDFEMFSVIFISYERTFDDSTSTLHNLINDRVFLNEIAALEYFSQLTIDDLGFITKRLSTENLEFYINNSSARNLHQDFEEAVLAEALERLEMERVQNFLNQYH